KACRLTVIGQVFGDFSVDFVRIFHIPIITFFSRFVKQVRAFSVIFMRKALRKGKYKRFPERETFPLRFYPLNTLLRRR
ncbi:MAG: hypothetical protein J6K50_01000, partial [Clostridia bacterium]|nr:hypothetical protein [Clostridia bacterium]